MELCLYIAVIFVSILTDSVNKYGVHTSSHEYPRTRGPGMRAGKELPGLGSWGDIMRILDAVKRLLRCQGVPLISDRDNLAVGKFVVLFERR